MTAVFKPGIGEPADALVAKVEAGRDSLAAVIRQLRELAARVDPAATAPSKGGA